MADDGVRSTDLQKVYAMAVDYVKSVALRNVIQGIEGGDVADAKWWLEYYGMGDVLED